MNDNELFELCKDVYERTRWKTGRHVWSMKTPRVCRGDDFMEGMSFALYSSDFLLEKLVGKSVSVGKLMNTKTTWFADEYLASVDVYRVSDTPVKALLKLTIALHEAGELPINNKTEGE